MDSVDILIDSKRQIRKTELYDLIEDTLIYNNITKYVDNIDFKESAARGFYNTCTKTLNINYNYIDYESKSYRDFNTNLLLCAFHEITHVYQIKQLYDFDFYRKYPTFYVLLVATYFLQVNDYQKYFDNHNNFVSEYNAHICSYKMLIKSLNSYDKKTVAKLYQKLANLVNNHIDIQKNNEKIFGKDFLKAIAKQDFDDEIYFKYNNALHYFKSEKNISDENKILFGYDLNSIQKIKIK